MYLIIHATYGSITPGGGNSSSGFAGSALNSGHVWITVHGDDSALIADVGFGPGSDGWG